jgi:hypothetical protein
LVALLSFESPKNKNTLEIINEKLAKVQKAISRTLFCQKTQIIKGNPTV